ncbi:hypothetical protein B0J17DRAFT_42993 [Rhizoctonia solani]|nr:hypothetical protein B0J17DRAFT_42993 [Rhizoctonia solani]
MLEIFTGDIPYQDYRFDPSINTIVERGTLPARPIKQLGDNQRGNLTWRLMMNCWSRDASDRPSSERVVDALQQLVSCNT